MEFEGNHDGGQEEEEEEEDAITIPPPTVAVLPLSYDPVVVPNSVPPSRPRANQASRAEIRSSVVRYRECLKNHAVGIGGHAVDGCGEFMAAGEEGTLDALKCAACNCHRNFHRKESDNSGETLQGGPHPSAMTPHHQAVPLGSAPPPSGALYPQYSPYYRTPGPPSGPVYHPYRPGLSHPSPSGGTPSGDDMSHPSSSGGGEGRQEGGSGGGGGGGSAMVLVPKKRHRTRFTQEQKEKMLAFAERLGWKIQKHDEAAVQQFCAEIQIKRQVLKVWMHNNKNTLGKK